MPCTPAAVAAGQVIGSYNFAPGTSVCRAALMVGSVDADGGPISYRINKGGNFPFDASTRNGVTSTATKLQAPDTTFYVIR